MGSETAGVDKTKTPVETPVTIISSSVVVPASPTTQTASKPPTKQKRKKPKRDPNEPRKNLTSYVSFSNYIRPIIRERSPHISFVDLSKQMGLEFKKLSPEVRKIWDEKAKEDKKRYELAMVEYRKTGAVASTDKQTPKKGKSSYNYYFQAMHDKMSENPEMTFGELSKRLGINFKNLSKEDRKPWEDLAKEDRRRALESNIEALAPLSTTSSSSTANKSTAQAQKRA